MYDKSTSLHLPTETQDSICFDVEVSVNITLPPSPVLGANNKKRILILYSQYYRSVTFEHI